MKRILNVIVLIFVVFFLLSKPSFAIENPTSVPNNKFGVHILFPLEIEKAAQLVNSNGGDWGYVTVPIQAGDKDLDKWQRFMNDARKLHVIPIIRLATEGDYFNTSVWKKPSFEDVLDFANFLDSLDWPTKNRYIVVFNEPNRSDEWVGATDPSEYAEILSYAVNIFKSKNQDYFVISGGLDNAAANISGKSMNEYAFMQGMNDAVPGIFNQIDGLGSHSYPNPGFKQPPFILTSQSIYSFSYEKNLSYRLSGKDLPIFITETGWSANEVSYENIASYFSSAFNFVWSDENIVAVTPFLLQAGSGPFEQFTFIGRSGKNKIYEAIERLPKIKGQPILNAKESEENIKPMEESSVSAKRFVEKKEPSFNSILIPKEMLNLVKWFLKL